MLSSEPPIRELLAAVVVESPAEIAARPLVAGIDGHRTSQVLARRGFSVRALLRERKSRQRVCVARVECDGCSESGGCLVAAELSAHVSPFGVETGVLRLA